MKKYEFIPNLSEKNGKFICMLIRLFLTLPKIYEYGYSSKIEAIA